MGTVRSVHDKRRVKVKERRASIGPREMGGWKEESGDCRSKKGVCIAEAVPKDPAGGLRVDVYMPFPPILCQVRMNELKKPKSKDAWMGRLSSTLSLEDLRMVGCQGSEHVRGCADLDTKDRFWIIK